MILVTGGGGYLGSSLIPLLLKNHKTVRVLALPAHAAAMARDGREVVAGDLTRPDTLGSAFKGVREIIHMASVILSPGHPETFQAVNLEGTRHLLRACEENGVKHFVFVSSISVAYSRLNPYSRSKLAAEELVRQSSIPHWTVVRPSLIYGRSLSGSNGGEEFYRFVAYLNRPVIPWIGSGRARKSPVHVNDLAAALAKIPGNPSAYGKTYNLSGGESIPLKKAARIILQNMKKNPIMIPLPAFLCRLLFSVALPVLRVSRRWGVIVPLTNQTVDGFTENADPDISPAVRDLNFRPRSFVKGMADLWDVTRGSR